MLLIGSNQITWLVYFGHDGWRNICHCYISDRSGTNLIEIFKWAILFFSLKKVHVVNGLRLLWMRFAQVLMASSEKWLFAQRNHLTSETSENCVCLRDVSDLVISSGLCMYNLWPANIIGAGVESLSFNSEVH